MCALMVFLYWKRTVPTSSKETPCFSQISFYRYDILVAKPFQWKLRKTIAVISVCLEVSRPVDTDTGASGKTRTETFHSILVSGSACRVDNAILTEKTAGRICGAPGLWLQLPYSWLHRHPPSKWDLYWDKRPPELLVLWDLLAPYRPGKSQPFSDHLRLKALRKRQAKEKAYLPNCSLILLALPAWWKGWRAVLGSLVETSSSPASPELALSHCCTWALNQFSLITL